MSQLGRYFTGPGGSTTDGAAPAAEARQEVGLHLSGGGESGGWV